MKRVSLVAFLLAGTAGSVAFGQSFQGSSLTATISERFEANSNYDLDDPSPGTSYFADTRLTLGFLNETPTQSFGLGFSTGARALWQAEEDFEFTLASPTGANLNYENEWGSGLFDAAFDYRQRQLDYTVDEFVDSNSDGFADSLNQLEGDSREMRYDANVGVLFGTDTRSTYELRFIGTQFDYSEENPDQVARTTLQGLATWTMQLNPILSGQVTGNYLAYDARNTEDTALRRGQLGLGLVYQPDDNLLVGLGVDYADRKRKDTNDAGVRETTESNTGPGINGNFTYTTPDLVFTGNGELTSAAPTTRFFGAMRADYLLNRGRITGRIFQNYTGTSSGSDEARVTGVSLGIVRNLTSVSSLGIDFAYATQVDVDDDGGTSDPDIDRANITATYSHALTDVVAADIGYTYRSRSEDPTDASSNSVFFQIGRTFETSP